MKLQHLIAYLFIQLFTISSYGQEPPEYADIKFIDTNSKVIFPCLTITGTTLRNSDLTVQRKTLKIDSSNRNNFLWRGDSTFIFSSVCGDHFLDPEMKIVAEHNGLKMTITMFGQGIVFAYPSFSLGKIKFREGHFLFLAYSDTSKLISVQPNFEIIQSSRKAQPLNLINKHYSTTLNDEYLIKRPETSLLEFLAKNNVYRGFIFENRIPYGYVFIDNTKKINKCIKFEKIFEKTVNKYYR